MQTKSNLYISRVKQKTDSPEEPFTKHKKTIKALKTNPTLSLRQIAKLASDTDYEVSANTVKKVKGRLHINKIEKE